MNLLTLITSHPYYVLSALVGANLLGGLVGGWVGSRMAVSAAYKTRYRR